MNRRKILLVEDEIPYAKYVIDVFSEHAPSVEIFHVNNGLAALALLNSGYVPDMVLSDNMMPKMTGHQLAARLRRVPDLQNIPIVIISGVECKDDLTYGQVCMADAHLPKPNNFKEMLDLIEQLGTWLASGEETSSGVSVSTH